MAIYTVHVPPAVDDPAARADRTAFVRDGFSGWAFWLGPFFLLRHRAWVSAVLWLAVVPVGAWLANLAKLPISTQGLLFILLQFFIGLEGSTFRRGALARRGYDLAGLVAGGDREDGERRFFVTQGDRASTSVPAPVRATSYRVPASAAPDDVIGLFPDREGPR